MHLVFKFSQFILLIELVYGRGSMLNPPQRSSLWRFRPWKKDKDIPKNLEDYGLNCGGFWRLHGINKGKCGVCGDPYDIDSRQNEAGGKYANGIIVRRYRQHRKFINVTIDVTANIGGHFEFRLCPNNNISAVVTQECLDRHQLTIEGHGLKFSPKSDKKYRLALNMPENVTCTQCVLQWKWRGSYNWGRCDDGYQDLGCGNQEEYYNCADIAILPSKRVQKPKQQDVVKPTEAPSNNINTIGSSKVVKIMSNDIKDIKTIDAILAEQSNKIDPVVSGIPVYIFKPEISTRLPPIEPPAVVVDNNINQLEPETKQNIGIPIDMDNTIYDLTSTNVEDRVKQDLVQSPGDNIFKKADWISGTSVPVAGVGVKNASGDGHAIASHIDTNTSITNKPALNISEETIGVLDATNDATLDPLTINRNVNMLSDMFYGAMIAGGEADLDSLLPITFFPTFTEPQPYGDLASQFMRSVHALKQQQRANETMHQQQLATQTGPWNNIFQSTTLSNENETVKPTLNPIIAQEKTHPMSVTKIENSSGVKSFNVENTAITSPLTHLTSTTVSPLINGVTSYMPTISKTSSTILNQSGFRTESPAAMQQVTNPPIETTYQTTVHPWRDVLLEMNSLLNNLNSHLDGLGHSSTIHSNDIVTKEVPNLNPNVIGPDILTVGNMKQKDSRSIPHNISISEKETLQRNQQNRMTSGNGKQKIPQQIERNILYAGNIEKAIPKEEGQNILFAGNVKKEIAPNKLYAGNVRRSNSQQTTKTLTIGGNEGAKDGVVVSDVGEALTVQDQRPAYVNQPSIIANGGDTSWGTLSQQAVISRQPETVVQSSGVYITGTGFTTAMPLDKNTPIIISDPKSNFSFQNLNARNVKVNNLETQLPSNVQNGILVSQPQLSQVNENSIISKPATKIVVPDIQNNLTGTKLLSKDPKDLVLPELMKSINTLNKLTEKYSNNITHFLDAAKNIISSTDHKSIAKTMSLKSPPSIQDGTVDELAQNLLSFEKNVRTESPISNKLNKNKKTTRNVWNMIKKPVPAGKMPSWAANVFNGLYVGPTTPMTLLDRTTPPHTGYTESFLDMLSRMWGTNNNGNAIF